MFNCFFVKEVLFEPHLISKTKMFTAGPEVLTELQACALRSSDDTRVYLHHHAIEMHGFV